jgi:exonuclease SbcD
MSLKLLFSTDLHLRASKPISRLDHNFFATQLAKIDEIRQIAEDEKVDLVILGGDIFDRPDVPHSVVIRAIRAFKKFKKTPVYSIVGNHDVYGYTSSTEDASAIGTLFESGAVRKLGVLAPAGGNTIIYPLHAYDDDQWTVPNGPGFKILVAHKMITNIPIPGADTLLIKNIDKETNADIILSGDIHTPHITRTENNHWFVNPGSMTRMSIADRDRQPQVAVVSIADNLEIECEFRSLGIRPAETVFDLTSYSERMAQETHAKDFVKTYVQAIVSVKAEAGDVGNAIIAMLEANSFSDDVRWTIKAYLDRTHKEVLTETEE